MVTFLHFLLHYGKPDLVYISMYVILTDGELVDIIAQVINLYVLCACRYYFYLNVQRNKSAYCAMLVYLIYFIINLSEHHYHCMVNVGNFPLHFNPN